MQCTKGLLQDGKAGFSQPSGYRPCCSLCPPFSSKKYLEKVVMKKRALVALTPSRKCAWEQHLQWSSPYIVHVLKKKFYWSVPEWQQYPFLFYFDEVISYERYLQGIIRHSRMVSFLGHLHLPWFLMFSISNTARNSLKRLKGFFHFFDSMELLKTPQPLHRIREVLCISVVMPLKSVKLTCVGRPW